MTEFNLEAAILRGMEATGLDKETFKDKYLSKLKVLQEGNVQPLHVKTKDKEVILSLEEMAINQVISCERAASKGDTEILFYLEAQDDAKLTKNKKTFTNMHIVVPIGNNYDLFHSETPIEGCVKIRATHWNNKSFRPGFYRGKINKSIRDGYTNYGINDIGTTERTFNVPEFAQGVPFRVLSAMDSKPVMRNVKGSDGQALKDENDNFVKEPVYKKDRAGNITGEPLKTRSMEILVLNKDGTKTVKWVSTVFDKWMDIKIDPTATYKGTLRENGPYINLNSDPTTSGEIIEIDNALDCDIVADLTGIRDLAGKFVKLQPMFGDAIVEIKQNPEKGTKIAYTTISDMAGNTINIVGDSKVFDATTNQKGNLAGIVQVIGKVFINKERDNPGIRVYAIKDVSTGIPKTESVEIVEEEAW